MRACKCGSVGVFFKEPKLMACKKCKREGPLKDFPHLHNQIDTHAFKSHATTGPGSHRVNPTGNKSS
jgi:hypothetical protein